jgi:hypothetical protein
MVREALLGGFAHKDPGRAWQPHVAAQLTPGFKTAAPQRPRHRARHAASVEHPAGDEERGGADECVDRSRRADLDHSALVTVLEELAGYQVSQNPSSPAEKSTLRSAVCRRRSVEGDLRLVAVYGQAAGQKQVKCH